MRHALARFAVAMGVAAALAACGAQQQPEAATGVMDGGQRGAIITNHKEEPLNKLLFDAGMQPILYQHIPRRTEPGVVFMPIKAPPFVAAGCSLADDAGLARCFVQGYFDYPNAFRGLKEPLRGQAIDTFHFNNSLELYGQRTMSDGRIDTYTCRWARSGKKPTVASIGAMPAQVQREMALPAGKATLQKLLTIDGVSYDCLRSQSVHIVASP